MTGLFKADLVKNKVYIDLLSGDHILVTSVAKDGAVKGKYFSKGGYHFDDIVDGQVFATPDEDNVASSAPFG